MVTKIVSENYFKYDQSDYAKSLRTIYGEDGYKKYTAKMNSIMTGEENLTNPIKASKEKYIFAKKVAYQQALAKLGKSENIWNDYKASYSANLAKARQENKDFYEVLDYYLDLIRNPHNRTYEFLGEKIKQDEDILKMIQ